MHETMYVVAVPQEGHDVVVVTITPPYPTHAFEGGTIVLRNLGWAIRVREHNGVYAIRTELFPNDLPDRDIELVHGIRKPHSMVL